MGNDTLGCVGFQDASRAVAAGVARRGQRPQSADAGESPHEVTRGQKLQTGIGIVDWLAFTMSCREGESLADVASWLLRKFPQGSTPLERGAMGYTHGWRLAAGGLLLFNPQRPDMGVHCECPSGLLSLLEVSPESMINMVLVEGGRFTRLDVAVDTDQVSIDQVDQAIRAGELVSRSQVRRYMGDYSGDGFTIYIGSGASRRMVRIYDKAAEQKVGGVWTRCEVQFRSDQAQMAACHIAGGVDCRSLILSALDFRDRSEDPNVTRCERLSWWESWIGEVKRVSFALRQTIEQTVERAYDWVVRQVAPTLAFLDKALMSVDAHWIWRICDANQHRIRPELRALLSVEGGAL